MKHPTTPFNSSLLQLSPDEQLIRDSVKSISVTGHDGDVYTLKIKVSDCYFMETKMHFYPDIYNFASEHNANWDNLPSRAVSPNYQDRQTKLDAWFQGLDLNMKRTFVQQMVLVNMEGTEVSTLAALKKEQIPIKVNTNTNGEQELTVTRDQDIKKALRVAMHIPDDVKVTLTYGGRTYDEKCLPHPDDEDAPDIADSATFYAHIGDTPGIFHGFEMDPSTILIDRITNNLIYYG